MSYSSDLRRKRGAVDNSTSSLRETPTILSRVLVLVKAGRG